MFVQPWPVAEPRSARISRRVDNEMTTQGNARGHPAIGSHGTSRRGRQAPRLQARRRDVPLLHLHKETRHWLGKGIYCHGESSRSPTQEPKGTEHLPSVAACGGSSRRCPSLHHRDRDVTSPCAPHSALLFGTLSQLHCISIIIASNFPDRRGCP